MERPFRATGSESVRMPSTRREERRIRPTAAFRQQRFASANRIAPVLWRQSYSYEQCVAACKAPDRTALSLSISFLTACAVEQKIILILESFIHTTERYATSERSLDRKKTDRAISRPDAVVGATGLMRRRSHEPHCWRQGSATIRKRTLLAYAFKSSYDGR